MKTMHKEAIVKLTLSLALVLNIGFWFSVRDTQAHWENVPPAPSEKYASIYGMGDKNLAYRMNGVMIQNMGDTGGRSSSLVDYDYDRLTRWFFLQDKLDPISNYIPYLATFYFGAVQEPEKFRPVLAYLEEVGIRPYGEKWRWLVYAIHITKDNINDKDKALEIANLLSQSKHPDMPNWTQQMPAFVMTDAGDKESAYALMVEILKSSAEKLHPNEVRSMRIYICTQILEPEEAKRDALCEGMNE